MSMELRLGVRSVGGNNPLYVVFEAGPTHSGLATAIQLVDVAAAAGADAVKFQIVDAERLIPDPNVLFTYEVLLDRATGTRETVRESLQAILKRRELTRQEWRELAAYAHSKGIAFFATATDEDAMQLLADIGADTIKIASGDINYHQFLQRATQYPWTVQIDNGSSTLGEIEEAVRVLEESGCRKIIINHCPSGYPAHLESIHLRVIGTLRQMFPYPVAFSDHTPGADMDIAALALGAAMIEKTITLDRTIRSPEHIMSLEPHEAAGFVQTLRDMEIALGSPRRSMGDEERKRRLVARRSVILTTQARKGQKLEDLAVSFQRPGDGLAPDLFAKLGACRVRADLPAGHKLRLTDLDSE